MNANVKDDMRFGIAAKTESTAEIILGVDVLAKYRGVTAYDLLAEWFFRGLESDGDEFLAACRGCQSHGYAIGDLKRVNMHEQMFLSGVLKGLEEKHVFPVVVESCECE